MKKSLVGVAAGVCLLAVATAANGAVLPQDGFSAPVGMLEAPDGSLLVAEWGADRVSKVDQGGKKTVISGIRSPAGLAADGKGAVYVAGYGDGNIYVWREGEKPKVLARGFQQPTGLLWLQNGTLLVANRGAGTVEEVGAGGERRIVSRGHIFPVGIVVTKSGDMYVSCYGGTLDRVSPDGTIQKIEKGLRTPGVGILAAGDDGVFVVDNAAGALVEAGRNGVRRILAENLPNPVGLLKTAAGELLVATWGDGKIRKAEIENE